MDSIKQSQKTPQQIEDEKKELEVQERRKNYKNKMKCIYLSIVIALIGEREINMILASAPDVHKEIAEKMRPDDEIDTEMKSYLEKMFALDTVEMKLQHIIQLIANRIAADEPTVQSILKCDSTHSKQGL